MALERLTENFQEMSRRARDFRPAEEEVHAELLTWQRSVEAGPEKNRLDPSLQNPAHPDHIWRSDAQKFTFGTRVPYSIYYANHRLQSGQRSHMDLPRPVLRRIATKLGRYILTGRTL